MNKIDSENFLSAGEKVSIILGLLNIKITDFAAKTGINPDKIYDSKRKNKKVFTPEEAEKILKTYPEISPRWLLIGREGDSLLEDNSFHDNNAGGDIIGNGAKKIIGDDTSLGQALLTLTETNRQQTEQIGKLIELLSKK